MEFDKSKVYSAVNADELKVGSKVILADNLADLRDKVRNGGASLVSLTAIQPESSMFRFVGKDSCGWCLAYLIESPDEKVLK